MMTNVLPMFWFGMNPLCTVGTPHQVGRCWHARGGHSICGVHSSECEGVLEVARGSRLNLLVFWVRVLCDHLCNSSIAMCFPLLNIVDIFTD